MIIRVARYGTCWQGRITCQPERLRSLKLGVDKAAKRVQPHQFSVPSFSQRVASQQIEPVGIAERIKACVRIKGPRRPRQRRSHHVGEHCCLSQPRVHPWVHWDGSLGKSGIRLSKLGKAQAVRLAGGEPGVDGGVGEGAVGTAT